MKPDIDEILMPPEELMGEAMLALNERGRRFVCALLVFDCNMAAAYKYAGYTATKEATAYANASRLARKADVQAAIAEENNRRLNIQGAVIAVKRLVEKAGTGNVQAINSILDRTGYHAKTEQIVHVNDDRKASDILAEVKRLLGANNLRPQAIENKPIDVEYTVVDPNDLSDIL